MISNDKNKNQKLCLSKYANHRYIAINALLLYQLHCGAM